MIKRKSILFVTSIILLTSCGGNTSDSSSENDKTNFEKATEVVSNFDIEKTNGYDYSLKQFIGKDEVNSDNISLRVNFNNNIKAKKVETIKTLNTYGEGEQFNIEVVTTYFSNNMICEYINDQWKWSNYKKSDYFSNAISNIYLDKSNLSSIKENLNEKYVLTADIPDEKAKDFFKLESISFTSVSLKLTISNDFLNFESLELSYFQKNTRSELSFSVYRGPVSIDLPN